MAEASENKVQFELVSPEALVLSVDADMVVVPGAEGDFGVLPRHSRLISTVRPGVIDVYQGSSVDQRIFVSGGFAEVTPERCTVLADDAVDVSAIDRGVVEAEIKDLSDDLAGAASDEEKGKIQAAIVIAQSKLAAAQSSN
ncbi:MAG TPA: ATP synthase F1 subunit epsilon [Alphaproteobacteria bacterium]|nr:ATP synthase F1 subunit epsilon [Alphaproteobacteria bacterium]